MMNSNIICKPEVIRLRFIRSSCSVGKRSAVKLAYTIHDQETSKEKPQKSPVLLLHSILNSKNDVAPLSKALNHSTKRTIIAIDARNHGESPEAPDMSYESLGADIEFLSENLKLDKFIFMGHSMGAGIAVFTALKYPHLVEKLVIIEGNPVETTKNLRNMTGTLKKLLAIDFQGLQTLAEAKKHADDALRHSISSPTVRGHLIGIIKELSPGNFGWVKNLPVVVRDFERHITTFPSASFIPEFLKNPYTKPALFIGGSQSDFLKMNHYQGIQKLFPRAHLELIEGAGHWPYLERPEELLRISSEFINSE